MHIHLIGIAALLALPGPVSGQALQAPVDSEPSTAPRGYLTRNIFVAPVPGLPFTGRETLVWTHRGRKGSAVTSTYEAKIARNSLGQVYLDCLTPTADPAIVPDMFFIVDRAAGMETQCFKASVRCLRGKAMGTRFSSIRKSSTDINLGEKIIDGLPVAGTRQTEVPEPPQSGSSYNSEFWYSHDLQVTLAITFDDSSIGTTTAHLAIVDRAEPDPALFMPPSLFAVDEPQVGVRDPVIISKETPEFSNEARRKKISGEVLVWFLIDVSGIPTQIRVVRGLGYGLDEKALDSVRKSRFKPAMRDGVPVVSSPMLIGVNFQVF